MLDITTKAVAETANLDLLDASDNPLMDGTGKDAKQVSITLHSPGSKEAAKAQNALNNRVIERLKRRGNGAQTAEEDLRQTAERLAAYTVSFNGFTYPGEYSTDKAMFVAAYSDRSIGYIADQVNAFIGDWGNFTSGSAAK